MAGQWRWLWLSPVLVLALASWCSLHGRALGEGPVDLEIAMPWAIRSAIGWTTAGILLGVFGDRLLGTRPARSSPVTAHAGLVALVFTITLGSETLLLAADSPLGLWLYDRSPLHLGFATLLVAGFAVLRFRSHERRAAARGEQAPTAQVPGDASLHSRPASASSIPAVPSLVEVMTGTGRTTVRIEDIECLEADRNYVSVHTRERSYLLRQTLASLEEELQPRDFRRIHRSIVVNRAMIRERRRGGVLVLQSGRTVKVSRAFARRLD